MAREEITKKNAPLIEQEAQKMGGMLPPELLQQFQQQNELEIAQRITELTNEMVNEEQELMNKDEKDPLINLKQQELMLRAQEVRQNRELAEQRLDLDLEKLNFNFLSNKYYSLSIPEKDITKKASCFINLKKEKRLNYLKIKQRCGVKSISYKEVNPAGSNDEVTSYELISDSDLNRNWIIITDYFYADANEDGYMDLVIRFKNDGSYSMASNTTTIVVTALNKSKYENINYSE